MNLFVREMKASLRGMVIWCVGIIALVGGGMSEYAGMSDSGAAMNALLADMPKPLLAVMGIGGLDVSTIGGYYGMLYLYLLLLAGVHAAMLGASLIAKEERDGTAEFLLTKPLSRSGVLTFKLLAGLVQLLVLNAVMLATSLGSVSLYEGGAEAFGDIALLVLGMLTVQFAFAGIGVAAAAVSRSPGSAVGRSAGIMVLAFLLSMLIELSGRLDVLMFATPFQYVKAADVLQSGLEPGYTVLGVAIAAGCVAVAYAVYNRRDMKL